MHRSTVGLFRYMLHKSRRGIPCDEHCFRTLFRRQLAPATTYVALPQVPFSDATADPVIAKVVSSGSTATNKLSGQGRGIKKNSNFLVQDATHQNAGFESDDVNVLLNLVESPSLILSQACQILSRLGKLVGRERDKIDLNKLRDDSRFKFLCVFLTQGQHTNNPFGLLTAMQSLKLIGVEPNSELMTSLETEMKWVIRRCPIKFVCKVVSVYSKTFPVEVTNSEEHANLLEHAIDTLSRRWVELTTGSDFISAFSILHTLKDEAKGKVEDRALEMVPEFSPAEIVRVIIILGMQKRRPTPLLRALSFHLCKSDTKIHVKEAIELIYALNELTFADPTLMAKLCSSIAPDIRMVNSPALISTLVKSLGQMRYKDPELMDAIESWILKHMKELRSFDFASWILCSAVVNIRSPQTHEICTRAMKLISLESCSGPVEWVNIVHSLQILDECPDKILSTVLTSDFAESIDTLPAKATVSKVKLLNLNAIAQNKGKKYKGQTLNASLVNKWTTTCVTSNSPEFSKLVTDALTEFLPPPKYLSLHSKSESGVYVDAICHLNEKSEPVPVDSTQKLPHKKVAFLASNYALMCQGASKDATGSCLLNQTLLENLGYQVLMIPFTEFSTKDKMIRRIQYLEQKLKQKEPPVAR